MKVTIYLDDKLDTEAIAWLGRQRNKSRSITRVLEREAVRDTPLTLGTMRAMVEDVVRSVLRDELRNLSGFANLTGLDDSHPDEEDPALVDLLDNMSFGG